MSLHPRCIYAAVRKEVRGAEPFFKKLRQFAQVVPDCWAIQWWARSKCHRPYATQRRRRPCNRASAPPAVDRQSDGPLKDERTVSQKVQLVDLVQTNAGTFAMITAHLTAKKALLNELREFHIESAARTCNAGPLIVSPPAEPMQSRKFTSKRATLPVVGRPLARTNLLSDASCTVVTWHRRSFLPSTGRLWVRPFSGAFCLRNGAPPLGRLTSP